MSPLKLTTTQKTESRTEEEVEEEFKPTKSEIRRAERVADQYVSNWEAALASSKKTYRHRSFTTSDSSVNGMPMGDVDAAINNNKKDSRAFLEYYGTIPCVHLKSGDMPICSAPEFFRSEKRA